jgi:hypothetical protein
MSERTNAKWIAKIVAAAQAVEELGRTVDEYSEFAVALDLLDVRKERDEARRALVKKFDKDFMAATSSEFEEFVQSMREARAIFAARSAGGGKKP